MSEETATPEEDAPESVEEATESAAEAPQAAEGEEVAAEATEAADQEAAAEPAEAAEEEAAEAEAEVEETEEEEEAVEEKPAKPAVPGADLEPIALEPDENLSAEERARIEAEAEEEQARREAELAAENAEEDFPVREPAKLDKDARFRATGKRKSAIARVILLPGKGQITVNGRDIDEYFPRALHRSTVRQPLVATGYDSTLDVRVRVHGGGISGQASAIRHGIARALTDIDGELRGDLKRRGYLTRDARVKERRKAGLKKARKRPQFSKR
jgi:small subunit ribosomal protein S9